MCLCSGKLELLYLSNNNIDDDGVVALIEQILHLFPSLERVYLDHNPVSDGMVERLEECLKINEEVSCYIVKHGCVFLYSILYVLPIGSLMLF